jgi:hypothetical protein
MGKLYASTGAIFEFKEKTLRESQGALQDDFFTLPSELTFSFWVKQTSLQNLMFVLSHMHSTAKNAALVELQGKIIPILGVKKISLKWAAPLRVNVDMTVLPNGEVYPVFGSEYAEQGYTDFRGGVEPTRWLSKFTLSPTTFELKKTTENGGQPYLKIVGGSNTLPPYGIAWQDAAGGTNLENNIEILVRFCLGVEGFSLATSKPGIFLRINSSGSQTWFARIEGTNLKLSRPTTLTTTPADTSVQTFALGFTPGANSKIWMRYKAFEDTHKVRVWLEGTPEPGTWLTERTSNLTLGIGWTGVGLLGPLAILDYVAFGRNGKAAPAPFEFGSASQDNYLKILTTSVPSGQTGTAYTFTFGASNAVGQVAWEMVSGAIPGLSLSASGVLSGTPTVDGAYTLQIRATDSRSTDTAVFTVSIADDIAAGMPQNVQVSRINASQILLDWDLPTDTDLAGTWVWSKPNSFTLATELEFVPKPASQLVLDDALNTTIYLVQSVDTAGNRSALTQGVSVGQGVTAPSNVSIGLVANKPRVTWQLSASETYTAIEIFRAVGSGAFSLLATLADDALNYTDSSAVNDTQYHYYLKSRNGSIVSGASSTVSIKTLTGSGLGRAKVLLHPVRGYMYSTPTAKLNALPVDALSLYNSLLWEKMFDGSKDFTVAELENSFASLSATTKEIFICVTHTYDPPNPMLATFNVSTGLASGTNAVYWNTWLSKWAKIAQVCANKGYKGIVFDEENYDPANGWKTDWMRLSGGYYGGYTQAQVEAKMLELGQMVGNKIKQYLPSCHFIMFHMPDTAYPASQATPTNPASYGFPSPPLTPLRNMPLGAYPTDYMPGGAFQCGVMMSLDTTGGTSQGSGEMWVHRSYADFQRSYNYRRQVILPNASYVPSSFRTTYQNNLKLAFFVGDFGWQWFVNGQTYGMSPATYVTTLRNAIANSDIGSYVIAYLQNESESGIMLADSSKYMPAIVEAMSIY